MRINAARPIVVAALALATGSCNDTALGPETRLTIDTPPDISATVAQANFESGNGPGGPFAQFDVWLVVPPGVAPNAGVVLPVTAPVFIRQNGRTYAANGRDIATGDRVDVWTVAHFVAYGSVQGPPGAPTYTGAQLVIYR